MFRTQYFGRFVLAVACLAVLAAGAIGITRLSSSNDETKVASSLPTEGQVTNSSGYMVAVG